MNIQTGQFDHIEDWLVTLHNGQWFGWDNKEKVYANLVVLDQQYTKPTEQECINGLKALQEQA
jgi:hypothetical protein